MQHNGGAMFRKRLRQRFRIEEDAFDERTPPNELAVAGRKIVIHRREEAGGGQRLAGMAADVSGTAGDEDIRMRKSSKPSEDIHATATGKRAVTILRTDGIVHHIVPRDRFWLTCRHTSARHAEPAFSRVGTLSVLA